MTCFLNLSFLRSNRFLSFIQTTQAIYQKMSSTGIVYVSPFSNSIPSVMYEGDVGVPDNITDTDFERALFSSVLKVERELGVVLTASTSPRFSCWSGKVAGGERVYHVSVMFNTTQVSREIGESAVHRLYQLLCEHFKQHVVKIFRLHADCLVIKGE